MISAKIIADSISNKGDSLTTFELEYPRFIHAEFMTHRQFSRNAASSRAIPVKKVIELIEADTAKPIHWGKNQPGMSAKEECISRLFNGDDFHPSDPDLGVNREQAWDFARNAAIKYAKEFDRCGYHKQIVNRLLEPFSHIKVVCTATEYDNFFWLRRHPDAQPEIQELAEKMWQAMQASEPLQLLDGEWHTPYYEQGFWIPYGESGGTAIDVDGHTLQEALAISSSCCAQVSYRKIDDSLEKAQDIYKRLVESKPVHASPFEHQGTPFTQDEVKLGATHTDMDGNVWSGNFRGWTQYRQLIVGNTASRKSFIL